MQVLRAGGACGRVFFRPAIVYEIAMSRQTAALLLLLLVGCSDPGWGSIEVTLKDLAPASDYSLRVTVDQAAGQEVLDLQQAEVSGASFTIEGVVARSTDLKVEVLVEGRVNQSGQIEGVDVSDDELTRVTIDLSKPPGVCDAQTQPAPGDGCCPPGATHADDPDCCVPGTLEDKLLASPGRHAAVGAGSAGQVVVAYIHSKRLHWAEPSGQSGVVDLKSQVTHPPAAAILPDGTQVIAYRDDMAKTIRVATRPPGGTWQDEPVDPNVTATTSGISLSVGVDREGFIHLAYLVGSWPKTPRHATNRTGAWKVRDLALKEAPVGDRLAMAVGKDPHFCHIPEGDRWVEHAVLKPSGLETTVVKTNLPYSLLSCAIAVDEDEVPHLFFATHSVYHYTHATPDAGTWRFTTSTKLSQPLAARIVGGKLHIAGVRNPTGHYHVWRPLLGVDWREVRLLNSQSLPLTFDMDMGGRAHAAYDEKSSAEGEVRYVTHCPTEN
jgi:hypothetical protein